MDLHYRKEKVTSMEMIIVLSKVEFETKDLKKKFNNVRDDELCISDLLGEYGKINVKTNMISGKIRYSDWCMKFDKDIRLRKKTNYKKQSIQLIFFINRNLSWNIVDRDENVYIEKGQACIYKDDFKDTFCNYQGGKNFAFKNIEISNEYFNNILYNIDEKNRNKVKEKVCSRLSKFNISPSMYGVLNEIDNAHNHMKKFQNIYLEGKILELIAIYFKEIIE